MTRIAVTGASGNIGRKIVEVLHTQGHDVVAVVRRHLTGEEHRPNVRSVLADYNDLSALSAAFAGTETVVMISSDGDSASVSAHHHNLIAAAVLNNVSNIVALSSLDADVASSFCYAKTSAYTERMLVDSGLSVSVGRASIFSEFFMQWPAAARETGEIRLPAADGRISFVSRDDVARSLAALAIEPQDGAVYDITGPEALDLISIAEIASEKFDTTIRYIDITPQEYVVEMAKSGLDVWWTYAYSTMFESIREQRWAAATQDVLRLTGIAPTPFSDL